MFKNKKATGAATPMAYEVGRSIYGTAKQIIAWLLLFVTLVVLFWPQSTQSIEMKRRTVIVAPGQTVWEIAQECQTQGDVRDIREISWAITKHNNLGRYIQPGDRLEVWMQVLKDKE